MTIVERAVVRAAFNRALELRPDVNEAVAAVAQSLGLPLELVSEALEQQPAIDTESGAAD